MKVVKIEYPTALSKIGDIEDDNIDVFVELEDGFTYVVVVITPKNYYWYMEKERKNHFCGVPMIAVKKLTEEIIAEAMDEYAQGNAYWLKYYHLSGGLDMESMDRCLKKQKASIDEFDRVAGNGVNK